MTTGIARPGSVAILSTVLVLLAAAGLSMLVLDRPAARLCWSLNPGLRTAAAVVSAPASLPVAIAVVAGLLLASFINVRYRRKTQRSQKTKLYLAATAIISWGFIQSLKAVFGRARPALLFEHDIYGFVFFSREYDYNSFPSGHTGFILGLAVALSFAKPRYRYPALVLGVVVAMSRVVAGAHFVSDVLAGAAIGTVVAFALLQLFQRQGYAIRPQEE